MSNENRNDPRDEIEEEEDDEPIFITLEFDDGSVMETEVLGVFEADGKEYAALIPNDGSDDVYIYGYKEIDGSDGDCDLTDITDDAEFARAVEVFDGLMAE